MFKQYVLHSIGNFKADSWHFQEVFMTNDFKCLPSMNVFQRQEF